MTSGSVWGVYRVLLFGMGLSSMAMGGRLESGQNKLTVNLFMKQ